MPQSTITKIALGTAAVLAQASGSRLHTLPGQLAAAAAPAPGGLADEPISLLPAPCFHGNPACAPVVPILPKHAVVLPPPARMSRAKHVEGGLRMLGCPKGDFSVPVVIGAPHGEQEEFQLLFDTGSAALGVFATGGIAEGANPQTHNVTFSTLPAPVFRDLPSTVRLNDSTTQYYGSGEWFGSVTANEVAIQGWPTVDMGIGEIMLVEDMLTTGTCDMESHIADVPHGIIGMDPGIYDQADMGVYASELQLTHPGASFSLALCDRNGTLVQGKPHAKYMASEFVYAAYQPGYYGRGIAVAGMRVGSQELVFNNTDFGQTMVDSGSTAVSLPAPIFLAFAEEFITQAGDASWTNIILDSGCFTLPNHTTRADLDAALPKITLHVVDPDDATRVNDVTFSATNFVLTPMQSTDGSVKVCSFIGSGEQTILGNIINVGNWLHYGQGVGFAKAQDVCEEM